MFRYTSIQTHSEFKKGKRKTKTQRVAINGNKGYKVVTVINKGTRKGTNKNGKNRKTNKKRLSKKEIKCIRKCQFIPGLFSDCEKCL